MQSGTEMEKRLARRIRNQRVRLRQLEEFEANRAEYRAFNHSMWFRLACRALKENRELRTRLGISEQFNQREALKP